MAMNRVLFMRINNLSLFPTLLRDSQVANYYRTIWAI